MIKLTMSSKIMEESSDDYERQRQENIARNAHILNELGLADGHRALSTPGRRAPTTARATPRKKTAALAAAQDAKSPSRQSARLRGLKTTTADNEGEEDTQATADEPEFDASELLPAERFFSADVLASAIVVDSHFTGWVNPAVCAKFGIEDSADKAWEAHGGGVFNRYDPASTLPSMGSSASDSVSHKSKAAKKSRTRLVGVPSGWSDAKFIAHKMFLKNPNMYFYRHTAPDQEHQTGEWTDEEKALFLDLARKYGTGDKWGLFASYIPNRVGYQCAAYYRNVILPQGLIVDAQYAFTPSGTAVFVGHRSRPKQP